MATKSSSDILNELFSTYNAKFDDPEESDSSSSSSSSSSSDDSKSKKKKKKKSKSASSSRSKDKEKRKKDGEKSKKPRKSSSSRKDKSKSKKKKGEDGHDGDAKGDKDEKAFKPTTIVLDIEEGEILDEQEKALRKSAKKKKRTSDEKRKSPKKSKSRDRDRHEDAKEVDHPEKRSSKHKHEEADRRRRSGSPSRRSSTSSSRVHRHSSMDNDGHRDRSPITRRAPPREKENERESDRYEREPSSRSTLYYNNYKTNWQKASSRDTSYSSERTYSYYGHDTTTRPSRNNNYNYYESRDREYYGQSRSGFGYSSSSSSRKYYDEYDDYYDYKRNSGSGRSRHRSSSRRGRSRSRSRSRSRNPEDVIDKAKLLEIARRNASKLMKKGCLPTDIFSRDQIVAIRAGGKSVEELIEYCQKLAEKDARGDLRDGESSSEDEHFINHPFQVKDRPLPSIVMNIKNAIPLPVRSAHELALENAKLKVQFPVSSGTRHRYKELEWRPVEEDEKEKPKSADCKSLVPVDGPKAVGTVALMPKTTEESEEASSTDTTAKGPLAITAGPSSTDGDKPKPKSFEETTINNVPKVTIDISELISMRLRAMRQLEENPDDADAKEALELSTKEMKTWAEAKALEPKFLTQAEITAGPQAWVHKDQLKNTVELKSGMGLHLLQKMGWKPGEGLGKNKEGPTAPLALDIKMDKKGLSSSADYPERGPSLPNVFDLSAKHPVSALMELCMKRKWGQPTFDLCFEHGPSHKKSFVYKVTVNGVEYQPCIATNNKKLAKAQSAAFCLQSLGLLPTTLPKNKKGARDTLRTVSRTPPERPKPTLLQTVPTTPTPTPTAAKYEPSPSLAPPLPADSEGPQPVPPPPPNAPKPDSESESAENSNQLQPQSSSSSQVATAAGAPLQQRPPLPRPNNFRQPQPRQPRPQPQPLFASPVLLPNPRFHPNPRNQFMAPARQPPQLQQRSTFTPLARPSRYPTPGPACRVPREPPLPEHAYFDDNAEAEGYDNYECEYEYDPMAMFGQALTHHQPMQMHVQMQGPGRAKGPYMQAAENLAAQANGQFLRPQAQAPYPPLQPPPPPPFIQTTYEDVPQTQVPLPQESGFPGLITF